MDGIRHKVPTAGELAARQAGVVTRAQLLALGFGDDLIGSWLRHERLHRRHHDVYAVGRPDLTRRGEWLAVGRHEVDALHTAARLAVELDGRTHHARRARMRDDRRRDADLQLAGLRVLRLVWEQLDRDEAPATARLVRAMLSS